MDFGDIMGGGDCTYGQRNNYHNSRASFYK